MSARILTVDEEPFTVAAVSYSHRSDIIASVLADGPRYDFDRAGAVSLIEALTAAVEAADEREAAEARKLKRGDRVRLISNPAWTYTVVTDEAPDVRGIPRVDAVATHNESPTRRCGELATDQRSAIFERIPS